MISFLPMDALDKQTRNFVTNMPGMCPKRDVGKVVTAKKLGGMGLHQVYRKLRTTVVSTI